MKWTRLVLVFLLSALPVFAQTQVCSNVATFSLAATTTTLIAVSDRGADICGFAVTGNLASTGFQLIAGSANLTPVMIMPANGNVVWSYMSPTFNVPAATSVTVSCTTGTCSGFVTYRYR